MQSQDSQEIIKRFFIAIDELKKRKVIRGLQTFSNRYGANRWNMVTQRKQPQRDMFQTAWLAYLVNDYGVSALWLLTGKGPMFDPGESELRQELRRIAAMYLSGEDDANK
jgi:hypothetical protein